jgi:polyisoprenoid-binding protein YceI
MSRRIAAALLCAGAVLASQAATAQVSTDAAKVPAGVYQLQSSHSQLLFSILHIGLTDYYGRFDHLSGTLNFDSTHPENSLVSVTVDTASVDTPSPQLNMDLKSADVFDTNKYPQASFKSVSITRTGVVTGKILGDLTLHGFTKRVSLDVTFSGGEPDPLSSSYAIGFRASGTIKRTDFGLTGMPWEPMVGDDVTLIIQAMFDQEKSPA